LGKRRKWWNLTKTRNRSKVHCLTHVFYEYNWIGIRIKCEVASAGNKSPSYDYPNADKFLSSLGKVTQNSKYVMWLQLVLSFHFRKRLILLLDIECCSVKEHTTLSRRPTWCIGSWSIVIVLINNIFHSEKCIS